MAIKSGRLGGVMYDPAGITPVTVVALNKWKLSLKTDHLNVTCFGAANKVYVPGMRDVSGNLSGFWDSDSLVLFNAAQAEVPGMLKLIPNSGAAEDGFFFTGLAYLDADIDCSVEGVPAISGSIMAAGAWTLEEEP